LVDRICLQKAIRSALDSVSLTQRGAGAAMTLVEGAEGVLVALVHDEAWLTFDCGTVSPPRQIGRKATVSFAGRALSFAGWALSHLSDPRLRESRHGRAD